MHLIIFLSFLVSLLNIYTLTSVSHTYPNYKDSKRPVLSAYDDIRIWENKLKNDDIKISTTDILSPGFSSRRYFYLFAHGDKLFNADYILLLESETDEPDDLLELQLYQELMDRDDFVEIYKKHTFVVYRNVNSKYEIY